MLCGHLEDKVRRTSLRSLSTAGPWVGSHRFIDCDNQRRTKRRRRDGRPQREGRREGEVEVNEVNEVGRLGSLPTHL